MKVPRAVRSREQQDRLLDRHARSVIASANDRRSTRGSPPPYAAFRLYVEDFIARTYLGHSRTYLVDRWQLQRLWDLEQDRNWALHDDAAGRLTARISRILLGRAERKFSS